MTVGDKVRIQMPGVFEKAPPVGVIVRMPLPVAERKRLDDAAVMVQTGEHRKPRPVPVEELELVVD